jgi:mannose-1-phosphate guanylyltransferase/phosphomannomutase
MKQAVILCGGKGTRLGAEYSTLPKPLVPVDGIPLLDRIIGNAVNAGIREVILAAGHLGNQIAARYGSHNPWDISIHTHVERKPLGTAGCLHEVSELLDDDFALLYGDVFLDFDLRALLSHHIQKRPVATVLVRQSDHPADSDLVVVEPNTDHVTAFLPKATRDPKGLYRNCANAAVYAVSKALLDFIPKDRPSDIATNAFPDAISNGREIRAHALEETGYVKDMGTPARLLEVERYWRRKQHALAAKSSPKSIRAVILDRDGVILRDQGPSTAPNAIEFMPGALEGLAAFAQKEIACMVATNQPWIARGLLTTEQLHATHEHMKAIIVESGGDLLDIAHSPYHPETHHGEGITELRRASDCRKPRPGMLFDLMERFGYEPSVTVMIGDSEADILAAANAGVRSILIGDNPRSFAGEPDGLCKDLPEAFSLIQQWNSNLSEYE